MSSENLKLFYDSVSKLSEGKSVGYSNDCDISYSEYKEMYSKELIKLNVEELIELYIERKNGKGRYSNVFLQAWYNCINLEMKNRNLDYEL